jgi:hypothetical protein
MTTATRKIGTNKGKYRLWIEGDILLTNGFPHKAPWILEQTPQGICLSRVWPNADQKKTDSGIRIRRVAGTANRPIIDVTGKALDALRDANGIMPDSVTLSFIGGHSCYITTNSEQKDIAA